MCICIYIYIYIYICLHMYMYIQIYGGWGRGFQRYDVICYVYEHACIYMCVRVWGRGFDRWYIKCDIYMCIYMFIQYPRTHACARTHAYVCMIWYERHHIMCRSETMSCAKLDIYIYNVMYNIWFAGQKLWGPQKENIYKMILHNIMQVRNSEVQQVGRWVKQHRKWAIPIVAVFE